MTEKEKIGQGFAGNAITGQTQCRRCVLDKSAREITFDANGVCNFCHAAQRELELAAANRGMLDSLVAGIKKYGAGKKYDVLIGLSGGVDSSYALHIAVSMGLRPYCFSVDNGWNDPKADENIMRLVEGLKVPFYRYTIDIPKFKELQAAFMRAGLPNIEIPTDHVLMATTYEMADKNDIKYVISGGNVATESIMPASWGYNARDLIHINDVYTRMTGKVLTGLPTCSLAQWNYYRWVRGINIVYLLDYIDYNREDAIKTLSEKYGYQSYGEKHCESTFTWWFQNYYLFEKFGFDKRKAHLSSMINSGQITREQALHELTKSPVYPQLGLEQRIWKFPKRSHDEFKKDEKLYNAIASFVRLWN